MITDTVELTAKTCDRCGPYVMAAFTVTVNGTELRFCGHCTRYGKASPLQMFAVPIVSEFAEFPTGQDENGPTDSGELANA